MSDEMDFSWDEISGANPDPAPAAAAEPPTPEAPPPAPSDAPAEPAEPDPTPPAPDPNANPAPEPPEEPEDPTSDVRIRLKGQDAHFARLRREGVEVEQAIKIAYPEKAQGDPPAPPPESDPLKAVTDELAQVQEVLDRAAEDESLLTPEIRKAQRRESELLAQKQVLETQQASAQEAQRQQEAETLQTVETKAWESAETTYPQIKDESSPLFKAVEKEWNEIASNPRHPLYSVADLPELLTAKHASKLGIAPAKASTAPAPPAPPPPAPPKSLQPVPGDAGRTAPPQNLTPAQIEAQSAQRLAKAGSDQEVDDILDTDIWGKPKGEREASFSFRF